MESVIQRNPTSYLHKYQPVMQGLGIDSITESAVRHVGYDSPKHVEGDALKYWKKLYKVKCRNYILIVKLWCPNVR